jgi:hypothetical protein
MSDDKPQTVSADRRSSRLSLSEWALGAFGVLGLAGFAVTFIVVLNQTAASPPPAPAAAEMAADETPAPAGAVPVRGEQGPRGERGPQGPPGPRGDAGIRILRQDCAGGDCTVKCEDDEVLLTAHCGIGRTPAVYPSQGSALCRSRASARVEVVAACVASSSR